LTTATYIPETDEFDIHTPCLEATKWWVGALVIFLFYFSYFIHFYFPFFFFFLIRENLQLMQLYLQD